MDEENGNEAEAGPVYSFRPSLMGAPREFRLAKDALIWYIGRHTGRAPYDSILRIRMSFRPVTMQSQRFMTEIWSPGIPRLIISSTTWKNMVEQTRQDREYSTFIRELHRRVADSGGKARFDSGAQVYVYWPGIVVFGFVSVAIAALIVRALQVEAYAAAAFIAAFFALFLWQTGQFFRHNRPAAYTPDKLPENLLPDRA